MRRYNWTPHLTEAAADCYRRGLGVPQVFAEIQKLGFTGGLKSVYNQLKKLGISFRSNEEAQSSRTKKRSWPRECQKCAACFMGLKTGPKWCQVCCPDRRAKSLLLSYNVSDPEYRSMMDAQDGICVLCPRPALVVDHCHKTGRVRGLLCYGCNSALGRFEEFGWIERASAYV